MKKTSFILALLFAIALSAAPLWAQFEGIIQGTVKDSSGKPMVGATIRLYDSQTGRKYELKTDKNGFYKSIA